MIQIVYSPHWFFGKDIAIDIVSMVVLLLIAFTSLAYFRIERKEGYRGLAAGFFFLAAAFLFKILMNYTVYYHVLESRQVGLLTFTFQTIRSTDTLFFTGFFLYRLLTLFGLLLLFNTYNKQCHSVNILVGYLLLVSTYFAQSSFYVFNLTALILLSLITIEVSRHYRKTKNSLTRALAVSFGILAASHLFAILMEFNTTYYVVAEVIQLVGYISLFITYILVRRHGKAISTRHHH